MNTRRQLILAVLSLSFLPVPALVAQTASTLSVPIAGTIFGLPESVFFSGTAQITVRPAQADVASVPRVVISIDLGDLSGKGLSSGAAYSASGQLNLTRRLVAGDVIRATIPFFARGAGPTARGRTAVASFSFDYDVTTGALTSARASLAAADVPAAN
jgi:hypothetical protein